MKAQNQKPEEKRLSSLLSTADERIPAPDKEVLKSLREQSVTDFSASSKTSERTIAPISIWRIIMTSRITKLATAAVIVVAVLICIDQFDGSIDGTTVAWAKVIETIENAHTFSSREKRILTCEGKPIPFMGTLEVMKYASSEYGVREDMQNNGQLLVQTYWLLKENVCVQAAPLSKQFTRKPMTEKDRKVLLQMTPDGIANMIRSSEYVELGRKTIDGVDVEGFEIRNADMVVAPIEIDRIVIRMWVNVETYLPVVIEAEAMTSDKTLTVFSGGKPIKVELFAGDFQWDVELDPNIFVPNIPDDYTMQEE
jgi:hypothetical protein